ncbi:isocitrate lyase/phosphoenolpyruvate mutase family protein [Micromonospora sp. NPDC003944]
MAAGADGIFVPGVVDPVTVRALVQAVPAPLNVMAGPPCGVTDATGRSPAVRRPARSHVGVPTL